MSLSRDPSFLVVLHSSTRQVLNVSEQGSKFLSRPPFFGETDPQCLRVGIQVSKSFSILWRDRSSTFLSRDPSFLVVLHSLARQILNVSEQGSKFLSCPPFFGETDPQRL